MRTRTLVGSVTAITIAATVATSSTGTAQEDIPAVDLTVLDTFETGQFDGSAAEIVAHYPDEQRLYVVNAHDSRVDILDVANPSDISQIDELDIADAVGKSGAGVNSVAVRSDGVIAVVVEAPERTDDGWVAFFDVDGGYLNHLQLGALPDSVTFTPDGAYALVANEGEPNDAYDVDPPGSVSVVSTEDPIADLTDEHVRTADFTAWDDGGEEDLHEDILIFGPDWTLEEPDAVSRNLEPEYVVSNADSTTAYVTVQEANAIAVIDIASAEVTDLWPLGFKDHLLPGNELDVSDHNDDIVMANWPIYGVYQPDGFDLYEAGGETFIVTANEGDARDWDGWTQEERFASLIEDAPVCDDSARVNEFLADNDQGISTVEELAEDENLGRLTVSSSTGVNEDEDCYEDIYAFGARSFSIWNTEGDLVFDSGSEFERVIADVNPEFFNSNNTENSYKTRSDDKGPEPEDVAIGEVGDRTYAFIGLERIGGVMMYDITEPTDASFVNYVNNRDFTADIESSAAGDLGAEGLIFIDGEDSPNGEPLLAVANEVSGSTTVFQIEDQLGDGTELPPGSGDDKDGWAGKLPITGNAAIWTVSVAISLIVLGILVLVALRRRQVTTP